MHLLASSSAGLDLVPPEYLEPPLGDQQRPARRVRAPARRLPLPARAPRGVRPTGTEGNVPAWIGRAQAATVRRLGGGVEWGVGGGPLGLPDRRKDAHGALE